MRTLAAIAIAPLAVIPVLAVLFGPWAIVNGGIQTLAGIIGPAVIAAYPLVILFGWPMHLALVRAQRTRRLDYAIAGALLGAITHAASGGMRDFASVAGMQADRYEVVVDDDVADRAASILRSM